MDRITGDTVADLGGGKRGFQDQVLSTGNGSQEGTIVTAAWLNAVQEEILKVITDAGLTPDAGDLGQLVKAIRGTRSIGSFISRKIFTATGTYNATAGTRFVVAHVTGGGGGGGTVKSGTSGFGAGGGGGGGGTAVGMFTAGFDGAVVLVGAGAAAENEGGPSSFLGMIGDGGRPGLSVTASPNVKILGGGVGAGATQGPNAQIFYFMRGFAGGVGIAYDSSNLVSGFGGGTAYGAGGSPIVNLTANGLPGVSYGSGGAGAGALTTPALRGGGSGAGGVVIINEYA